MAAKQGKIDKSMKFVTDEKPIKVDKWDGTAVKNGLDDAVKKIFTEHLGCVESHSLTDGRLLICSISVGFAMFALIWDYLHPFPESRPVLIACVASYFLMMGVLTLYTTIIERGHFLVALDKDKAGIDPDNTWKVASQLKRYDDTYHLFLTYTNGEHHQTRSDSFSKIVSDFFDENGYLCTDLFEPEVLALHSALTSEKKDK